MIVLHLRNRQRAQPVDLRLLRRITRAALVQVHPAAEIELGVHLVAAPEMIRLNETYLRHAGSTDVITFNYADASPSARLHGEIFVCVGEAVRQARRYRTSWPAEIVRYVVHGLLHLRGFDDRRAAQRREMKRAEDRLLRKLAGQFSFDPLAKIGDAPRPRRRHRPSAGADGDAGLEI